MRVIHGFKVKRRGRPTIVHPTVTVLESWRETLRFFGEKDSVELRRRLRGLRDAGLLVAKTSKQGGLQSKLRDGKYGYVLVGEPGDFAAPRRPRARIRTWA